MWTTGPMSSKVPGETHPYLKNMGTQLITYKSFVILMFLSESHHQNEEIFTAMKIP